LLWPRVVTAHFNRCFIIFYRGHSAWSSYGDDDGGDDGDGDDDNGDENDSEDSDTDDNGDNI